MTSPVAGLSIRGLGVVGILTCLLTYQPGVTGVVNQLAIPALAALSFWLVIRRAVVVCIAGFALSVVHADPGADHWVPAIAWPMLALAAGVALLVIWIHRLRARIGETRAARWASREETGR